MTSHFTWFRMDLLGTVGRVFLIVLNAIFIILGLTLIGIGGRVYDQGDLVDEDIQPLLNELGIGNFSLGSLIEAVAKIIIIIGVFVFLLSLCGALGAILKLRPCLIVYAVIIILLCLLEITIAGFLLDVINELNNTIKDSLLSILSSYEGNSGNALTMAWNYLFLLLDCCGVNKQSEVDDFASTTWASSRGTDVIPGYCCIGATKDTASGNQACTQTPTTSNAYYSTGCYDNIYDLFHTFASAVVTVTFLILVVEVVAVVASFIMVWQITQDIKKKKGDQKVHPTNTVVYTSSNVVV